MEPWLTLPDHLSAHQRIRLLSVRYAIDGIWFSRASGNAAPSKAELKDLENYLLELLKEEKHD